MQWRTVGAAMALLTMVGCKSGTDAPPPAFAGAVHEADVRFMQEMIGHHAQALTMVALAETRTTNPQLLQLVEKIDISQTDEIKLMEDWLTERGQPLPDLTAHQHHLMPGMLTDEQMAQLAAAQGAEFDRLFLLFMIQHHEGALAMADTLSATPGAGQDSDIFRFVTDVGTDQRDEIYVMDRLLSTLPRSSTR